MDTITTTSLPSKAQFPIAGNADVPFSSFLVDNASGSPLETSTSSTSSNSSNISSPQLASTSPQLSLTSQNALTCSGSFPGATPGSPNQIQLHQSMPMQQSPQVSTLTSQSSCTAAISKKPTNGSSDDSQTYHAHIDDERVIEYDPTGKYGKGAYKVVWKALDFKDGYEVAWNCFQTSKQESTEFSQEIEILKQVRHPNIITFRDAWYNNGEFVFITELITSGTLREYIQKLKKPCLKIVRSWTRQILNGLLYLHSHSPPIIHRDIKCDNIFINGAHGEVKIGDMGTAKMKVGKKYTVIGTPEFMAPEMYDERGYSEKVDVYAFGMCLLEMVTAEYPYSECKNAAQIYKKVSSGVKPECLSRVADEMILSLIQKCIAEESERISVREILEHPFFVCEPELVLLGVDEARFSITLQVILRNPESTSFRFEYNLETDTVEEVVSEMIDEQIIPDLYRSHLIALLNRQIRNFHQNFPFAMEIASVRRIKQHNSDQANINQQQQQQPQAQIPPSESAASTNPNVSTAPANNVSAIPNTQPPLPFTNADQTAITPPTFIFTGDSISAQLSSSSSLQPSSLRNWKRESQYKAELTSAQKEMISAVERAVIAEKRASEIDKLMKATESKRTETDLVIENLRLEIKNLKDQVDSSSPSGAPPYAMQQRPPTSNDDTKRYQISNTVLEQSYSPSGLATNGGAGTGAGGASQGGSPPKRPNSPTVASSVSNYLEGSSLVSSATEPSVISSSSLPQQSTFQCQQQQFIQQQVPYISANTATPPPGATFCSSLNAYPSDNMSVEELVSEVALSSQRSPDKAYEWAVKLQMQDILTVGDLRQLHETDWANLNLTVFATRALKNAISRRPSLGNKSLPAALAPSTAASQQSSGSSTGHALDSDLSPQSGIQPLPAISELSLGSPEDASSENCDVNLSSATRNDGSHAIFHLSYSSSENDDYSLANQSSVPVKPIFTPILNPGIDYPDEYSNSNYSFE